jgi:RHS repeat-associated protein
VLQSSGNTVRTTLYADSYERITENGQSRHFYYLDGGVIYVLNDGASVGSFYYTFTDHLGSITRIYNKNGTKVFSAEYDAWGNQTITLDILDFHRGYTGHEMLPEFNLINMNGRLYDPVLGRFLSPDNYVQCQTSVRVSTAIVTV